MFKQVVIDGHHDDSRIFAFEKHSVIGNHSFDSKNILILLTLQLKHFIEFLAQKRYSFAEKC